MSRLLLVTTRASSLCGSDIVKPKSQLDKEPGEKLSLPVLCKA